MLAIVVPTYNTRDMLRASLTAVLRELEQLPGEQLVIVVDNASQDSTMEMVRNEFPAVTLIDQGENRGPACSLNAGLRVALTRLDVRYVLVANSDTEPLPGTVGGLVEYLEAHPEVAGAAGRLLNSDGTLQWQRFFIARGNNRLQRCSDATIIDFVGTTFALIRAEAFRAVGGYDERFYFYNEDADWAVRAARAGLRFALVPSCRVIHHRHGGSGQNRRRILRDLYRANLYFYRKHYRPIAALAFAAMSIEVLARSLRPSAGLQAADYFAAWRAMVQEFLRPRRPQTPML